MIKFNFFEDGCFAYKVLSRAKKMRVILDIFYRYNIENPSYICTKTSNKDRLSSIFEIIKETCNDWKKLGIFEKYKYNYISHILTYTSLVCPDAIEDNYTKELNNSFGLSILDEDILNNVSKETINQIFKMTGKV